MTGCQITETGAEGAPVPRDIVLDRWEFADGLLLVSTSGWGRLVIKRVEEDGGHALQPSLVDTIVVSLADNNSIRKRLSGRKGY